MSVFDLEWTGNDSHSFARVSFGKSKLFRFPRPRCLIIDEPASDEYENTSNAYDIIIINIQECDNSDKSFLILWRICNDTYVIMSADHRRQGVSGLI